MKKRDRKKFQKRKEKKDAFRKANFQRAEARELADPLRARVIEEVQRRAMGLGFQMEGRLCDGGFDHWMFSDYHGKRILDYWPSTGTYYDKTTGFKGTELSICSVMEMAETILNERQANENHRAIGSGVQ